MLSKAKHWKPLEVRAAILDPWGMELLPTAYTGALAKADEDQNEKEMAQECCLFLAKQVPDARRWKYKMASEQMLHSSSSFRGVGG